MNTLVAPFRYRGAANAYVDIAVRGETSLGLGLQYAVHPTNVGYLIVRFVAHGGSVAPKGFTHLSYREPAQFAAAGEDGSYAHASVFNGARLNKVAIPVFSPAVHKLEVAEYAAEYDLWDKIAGWVTAQVTAEGFALTVEDLDAVIRDLVVPPAPPKTEGVTFVLELPSFDAPKPPKLVPPPVADVEGDEADDEEDDEEKEEKDWLN